jgi:integrase
MFMVFSLGADRGGFPRPGGSPAGERQYHASLPCIPREVDVALTDAQVRAAKPGQRQRVLRDDLGLELLVTPAGTKVWRFRYRFEGKQQRITIGRYPETGLAAARSEAAKHRAKLWGHEDPGARAPVLVEPEPAPEPESEGLDDVVERFLAARELELKASTMRTYRSAIGAFTSWAATAGVLTVADVTAPALARFRAHAIGKPAMAKARGGSRHDVASTGERRSAAGINCELRAVASMLQALRRSKLLPACSSDDIEDNLAQLSVDHVRPIPLRPAQLRDLIAACKRHDLEHEPVLPLVQTMLLGGFRLGEALRLHWSEVDLDEQTILVLAGKNHRERLVDLDVSPSLVTMLRSMRRTGPVFDFTKATAKTARMRLIDDFGAPPFQWSTRHSKLGARSLPTLRSTCACYLTCSPSIYGGNSLIMSAQRLGHTAEVQQANYLGVLRRIPASARTLEAAMEIESELKQPSRRLRAVK